MGNLGMWSKLMDTEITWKMSLSHKSDRLHQKILDDICKCDVIACSIEA